MSLRENTDYNLQTVSLVTAVLAVLFIGAARHYTTDWRTRRIFKRKLAQTHSRLKSKTKDDLQEQSHRVKWKRLVAALPFMPLATAYVVARLSWDIFEIMVFFAIDICRETTSHSVVLLTMGAQKLALLAQQLEVRQKLVDTLIVVVESTVGFLFNTAFPAIGDGCGYVVGRLRELVQWWHEVGAGEMLRDGIEILVLEYLVPGCQALKNSAVAVYCRAAWLIQRVFEAAIILAGDLTYDLRVVWKVVCAISQWMTLVVSSSCVWIKQLISQPTFVSFLKQLQDGLWQLGRIAVNEIVPAIRIGCAGAHTLFTSCIYGLDWLLQLAMGLCVRGARLIKRTGRFVHVRVYPHLYQFARGAVLWTKYYGRRLLPPIILRLGLLRKLGQPLATLCMDIYTFISQCIFVPLSQVLYQILSFTKAIFDRHVIPAFQHLLVHLYRHILSLAQIAGHGLAVLAQKTYEWASFVDTHRYMERIRTVAVQCIDACWQAICVVYAQADVKVREWLLGRQSLWPVMSQAMKDGLSAMGDVYRQLVAMVDKLAEWTGDHLVGYARDQTIHGDNPKRK